MARGKRAIDNREAIASCHICNTAGLTVTEVDEDYISFNLVSDKILSSHKRKLYESTKRGQYFSFQNATWYLDEFLTI